MRKGKIFRPLWLAILVWSFCAIGEATNPGPSKSVHPQIGCINPTGLLGKGSLLQQLPQTPDGTIWAVSETHLTQPGIEKMHRELSLHKTGLTLQAGAPVPSRSNTLSAIGGRQRGVGFLTNTPHRCMTASWTKEQWYENRIHSSCFLVANRWIQGGVLYGYPKQPDTLETKQKTENQCQLLIQRLAIHSSGLRFIAGDFNQPHGGIQSMQQLCGLGWISVQHWAQTKFNKPVQPTCKGSTTVDHIFVSPELALYLNDVQVDPTLFPDHAILWAQFDSLGKPPMLPMWKQPLPLDWKNLELHPEHYQKYADDLHNLENPFDQNLCDEVLMNNSKKYACICQALEKAADAASMASTNRPLLKKQLGRAKITEVTWVQEYSAPPKAGRHGDIAPNYHGIDPQHARLLRQTRRLVNYVRLADNQSFRGNQDAHRDLLWTSIVNAKGFMPNFSKWWMKQNHPGIEDLPMIPPNAQVASEIAKIVEAELRQYEKAQLKYRVHKAKLRRNENPNLIFKDLRGESPAPLQALVDTHQSRVTTVDSTDFSVEVFPSHEWKEGSIFVDGHPHTIIHAEPDKVWLDSIEGIQPNSRVTQETLVGDLPTLFDKFATEWKTRWDRHLETPNEFWNPIIEFAVCQLQPPSQQLIYEPISYERWIQEVKCKKSHAAIGPDGISTADLLHMPKPLVEALLELISGIENGQEWPRQVITGFVVALEKTPGASQVSQFRPITIFSLTYRVWSSIRSKQLLQHLRQIAPETCMGNLPQKTASHVWAGVQQMIELAHHHMGNASGAVIDLVKAFNLLPRLSVLEVITHLGAPIPIVRAWTSSITQMERRFRLRQCVGPPVKSTTGFAEGDGLSVVAMLTINFICHQWVKVKHQAVTLWSYVDNIEVTAESTDDTLNSLQSLQQVTKALDLLIDTEKTYTWSITTLSRHQLREADATVRYFARDLGGHMQYSAQSTNKTITQRIANMTPVWNRLARSLAPYGQKLRAVRSKGWAYCLHAISSAHVGDCHFSALRTGVMQAIAQNAMGSSPTIQLSLIENPLTDPQCFAIWQTVSDFRSHNNEDAASFVWQSLSSDHRLKPPPGPCSVMLSRLQSIAWEWRYGAWFLDHNRDWCNIFRCPIQELRWKIIQGWQMRILHTAEERKTFGGFRYTSPKLTLCKLQNWLPDEQALLRKALNGAFFTSDKMKHIQSGTRSSLCKFCHHEDSQYHRHWECPHFSECRLHLSEMQIQEMQHLFPCLSNHGWLPEPPSLTTFYRTCQTLPDTTSEFHWPKQLPSRIHAFTDGGCLVPANSFCRLASWGCVIALDNGIDFHPISGGVVPGLIQTALRGEILAACSALELAVRLKSLITVWTDNDLVYKRLKIFHSRACWFKPSQKDHDLWSRLHDLVRQAGELFHGTIKVVSHQQIEGANNELEWWAYTGNNAADSVATTILQAHPLLGRRWHQAKQDVASVHVLRQQLHRVVVEVGRRSVLTREPPKESDALAFAPRLSREDAAEVSFQIDPAIEVPLRYQIDRLGSLVRWLMQLRDETAPVQLVSWFQMLVAFEMEFKGASLAYSKHTKRWTWLTTSTTYVPFVRRANLLAAFLQGLLGAASIPYRVLHIRPTTSVLTFWTQCLAFRFSHRVRDLVDDWFAEQQGTFSSVRALRSLR